MSGGWVAAVVAAVSIGSQVYSSRQQAKAQRSAARDQARAAEEARQQQEQAFRAENQKEVDVSGLQAANPGGDVGATMLTGSQGVNPEDLLLGKGTNLLGG